MTMPKSKIEKIIFLGDSVSDTGKMYRRKFFPGLRGHNIVPALNKSPLGAFTNGVAWPWHFAHVIMARTSIKKIQEEEGLPIAGNNTDCGHALISKKKYFDFHRKAIKHSKNGDKILYNGQEVFINFAEGGATAFDYSSTFTPNISKLGARQIVSSLEKERTKFLKDEKNNVSESEKKKVLIVEWTGANDLVTVNKKPTKKIVDNAVNARIHNLKELIGNGYTNFVLVNLPDISQTPRFQEKSAKEQETIRKLVTYFNTQLQEKCDELKKLHPEACISIFDAAGAFKKISDNPEHYGFNKAKRAQQYLKSDTFKENKNDINCQKAHISPASGYMFWDGLHPSADMHAALAEEFYEHCNGLFDFELPESSIDSSLVVEAGLAHAKSLQNDSLEQSQSHSRKEKEVTIERKYQRERVKQLIKIEKFFLDLSKELPDSMKEKATVSKMQQMIQECKIGINNGASVEGTKKLFNDLVSQLKTSVSNPNFEAAIRKHSNPFKKFVNYLIEKWDLHIEKYKTFDEEQVQIKKELQNLKEDNLHEDNVNHLQRVRSNTI
ncbi:hypothetical protein A6J39_015280 [Legionella anisa]|uniref:Uncharacterized protein n=2 Tax=Legionella anisa TaxID=28082 RepID=A0AAX0WWP0_9GAMM|nr:hypothetical protein DLD14_07120 [Legionella anisa]PNL62465.1 hypothetical protein A6J39_015280 [Legionella anisa]